MYEFKASQAAVEQGLWPNLLCLDDPSAVNLYGHGTTIERDVLSIDLKRCKDKPSCQPTDKIEDFIASR